MNRRRGVKPKLKNQSQKYPVVFVYKKIRIISLEQQIWTIKDIIDWSKNYFAGKGVTNPRLNIELILTNILKCNRIDLYLKFDKPLQELELKKIREYVLRRGKREPLQYILGEVEFCGFMFKVDKRALIPRPETEELVEFSSSLIKKYNYKAIIDIGTGSGCIPISLALMNQSINIDLVGLDISSDALTLAQENSVIRAIPSTQVNWIQADFLDTKEWSKVQHLLSSLRWQDGLGDMTDNKFDLIISNPPYVTKDDFLHLEKELLEYEPHIALTDFSDGLSFYRQLVTFSDLFLSKKGSLVTEIGYNLSESVCGLFEKSKYSIEIIKDMQGIDRIAYVRKIE